MKLDKHTLLHKKYLTLSKQYDEVRQEKKNQPLRDVKPFQSGWKVFVSFRDDIMNRDDVYFLFHLLSIGYEKYWITRNIKHIKAVRNNIYAIVERNNYVNLIPRRKKISIKQYESFTAREQKWFTKYETIYNHTYYKINIPLYWIKLKVKPNIVTQIKDINPELESQYQLIRNELNHNYWWRFDKGKGYKHRIWNNRSYIKQETQNILKQEFLTY